MKAYQIWYTAYVVNDEDWCNTSGNYENGLYSDTIYLNKEEAENIVKSIKLIDIDRKIFPGLTESHTTKVYLKELNIGSPEFKVIIAGGRDFNNYELLKTKCDYYLSNLDNAEIVVISGTARGADSLGEQYAKERGYKIDSHPADWDKYGKSAGYRRNKEMVDIASAAICFWDGKSKGTKHTIDLCKDKGIPYKIVKY